MILSSFGPSGAIGGAVVSQLAYIQGFTGGAVPVGASMINQSNATPTNPGEIFREILNEPRVACRIDIGCFSLRF